MPTRRSLKDSPARAAQSAEFAAKENVKNGKEGPASRAGGSARPVSGAALGDAGEGAGASARSGASGAGGAGEGAGAGVARSAASGIAGAGAASGVRSGESDAVQEGANVSNLGTERPVTPNAAGAGARPSARKSAANRRVATQKAAKVPARAEREEASDKQEPHVSRRRASGSSRSGRAGASPSKRAKKPRSPARIALSVAIGVFAAFVVACIALAVDRWWVHDDAQDIQGTWYIYDTEVAIPIGPDTIGISEDAVYEYTIDTQAKTVTYRIGNLTGTSHYRFSSDRSQIALIEDGKKVFTATLFDDISWWFTSLANAISGKLVLPGPLQSNVIMLTRTPLLMDAQQGTTQEETVQEGAASEDGATQNASDQGEKVVQTPSEQDEGVLSPSQPQEALRDREALADQEIRDA